MTLTKTASYGTVLISAATIAFLVSPWGIAWMESLGPLRMVVPVVIAVILSLAFDYVNGFHDTANACATIVHSGVLSPSWAIGISATANFLGALLIGTTVALFITGVVPIPLVTMPLLLSVLIAGLIWNLLTYFKGLPVSSTHCLIGSLVGAGLAAGGTAGVTWWALGKALIGLVLWPIAGLTVALLVGWIAGKMVPHDEDNEEAEETWKNKIMPWVQVGSSAALSFSHGSNDGQKTMGIITLILATQLPTLGYTTAAIPLWVMVSAAFAMFLGTAVGGYKVMETVGKKISHKAMTPTHGASAELTTAATVFTASWLGFPASTTHVLTSAVFGATCSLHGKKHANMSTFSSVLKAWVLTMPVAAIMAALLYQVFSRVM